MAPEAGRSAGPVFRAILHVTRDFPPRHCGGVSTAVGELVAAQVNAGLRVAVVSFDGWRPRRGHGSGPMTVEEESDGAVPVQRLASERDAERALAWAGAVRPAIVHVHDAMLARFAGAVRASASAAMVYTAHVLQQWQNALRATAERTQSVVAEEQVLASADRVIAPSAAAAAALRAGYPAVAARLRVVGHGITDTAGARASAARHAAMPGVGPLLAVGRFAEIKGTAELFAAIRLVLASHADAEIVVAGGVPANPRAERAWLRRWHAECSTAQRDRARFAGWLQPLALAGAYRDAAAVMIASRYESFGLVALEASLHGVPLATTDGGALPELIEHDRTGLVSRAGDPRTLAANALRLLREPTLASRLSRAAAAEVRARHLWAHALPRILAVYAELT